ncbi:efflux RND transporter periplasmic adaptor subunit (plasmid) [Brasilonema octagenarum UFV-E1]|uniref:Efflux RND transporter periplasmic adaptor subunit n=1 Tax=Brasilonema sennae CENA114 TaxID=415709 RepID=A0A856MSC5_9CYAN|nr:efflux RND transporter periplasmic adaptor subunit [Brasilonema sennae]QDL12591.1 efflux RND transporter periplasmic adaptor subunit [Brasilonema sennae CENA114]QDL18986.1 efflux RND transporter periplasmic adaptor subunit [Brasilonema octagenarum UFV-E1]
MHSLERSQKSTTLCCISGGFLSLLLLIAPTVVLAHGGDGDEFQGGSETSQSGGSVEVDALTAKQLGIKVEPVKRQRLSVGIKTTGQIETLPSQKAEVTTPISKAKVVELLVEPGAVVKKGQPVAVVTSPDLVELRVNSQEKLAEGQADLQQAQADLRLAQQNYEKYQQIAADEIASAQSKVTFAQEKYDKDKVVADAGALPRRNALESQTQLAEAKAELTKTASRRDVIDAENKLKRAQASVEVAKRRIQLSNTNYETRLQQLGNSGNTKGLVTVSAPISGRVADREVTLGQSFEDAGGKLMTIVNDSRVYAIANIYEKDLGKVKTGQRVSLKVASVPNRTFTGRVAVVGSVVEGETRVVPVKAEVDNPSGVLKPGMFAELEVLTDQTSAATLAIPKSAVVEANNKTIVYVQNGNAFKSTEVTLGQTSGDLVEVTQGLSQGNSIVTQRAPQLYAQSLRGGSKSKEEEEEHSHKEEGNSHSQETKAEAHNFGLPLWLIGALGGTAIATGAFIIGSSWSSRRTRSRMVEMGNIEYDATPYETEIHIDNHKQPTLSTSAKQDEERENPHQPH